MSAVVDSGGGKTAAAAAGWAAGKHLDFAGRKALVLGGTGPVGRRVCQLLAQRGTHVRVGSRARQKAQVACNAIAEKVEMADLRPCQTATSAELKTACRDIELIVGAGAAGTELVSVDTFDQISLLKVAIDLNAVPPAGIATIGVTDRGADRNGVACYGAIGVGTTKMKIHQLALNKLFTANEHVLDTEAIYALGESLT